MFISKRKTISNIALICLFIGGILFFNSSGSHVEADTKDVYKNIEIFTEVLRQIEKSYVEPPDPQELMLWSHVLLIPSLGMGIGRGSLTELHDPGNLIPGHVLPVPVPVDHVYPVLPQELPQPASLVPERLVGMVVILPPCPVRPHHGGG